MKNRTGIDLQPYYTYKQCFNSRPMALPEISFDEKSVALPTIIHPATVAQFDTPEPQLRRVITHLYPAS